ncbi:MAG: hypothetical protein SGBAC_005137 [Bacillariaceae sp.]
MKIHFTTILATFATATAFVHTSAPAGKPSTSRSLFRDNGEHGEVNFAQVALASVLSAALVFSPSPALADGQTEKFKLPPIDKSDKGRCSLNSSSMGQANAARDKLYDLRECNLAGSSAPGFDLSGVIMTNTDVSKVNFKEAYFSKGYLQESNFEGADFTNAIVDRATFKGSSLRGTIFTNAVLTGTSFDGADLEGADFTEAAIGSFDLKKLCKNPTLKGENPTTGADTQLSAGCLPSR